MKKTALAVTLITALLVSLMATNCPHPARADSTDFIRFDSGIIIYSPLNKTYNYRNLTLNLTLMVGMIHGKDSRVSLNYSIDGVYNGQVPLTADSGTHVIIEGTGSVDLPELPDGSHYLTLYLYGFNTHSTQPEFVSSVNTVYFTIDSTLDSTPPNILVLWPENKTYTVANVTVASIPLNFTVNENISQVSYSLDGHDNATIAGNTTLTGLSVGEHNVTVYAWDAVGNVGSSQTINFAVAQETEPEPFPIVPVAVASVASLAVVAAALLVYFKKRKRVDAKQVKQSLSPFSS